MFCVHLDKLLSLIFLVAGCVCFMYVCLCDVCGLEPPRQEAAEAMKT